MRTNLKNGDILSLYVHSHQNVKIEFEIVGNKPLGSGSSAVCYSAKKIENGSVLYGRLKELYPIKCQSVYREGCKLITKDDKDYTKQKKLFLQSFNELQKIRTERNSSLFNNFIPYSELYYGERNKEGSLYVFTPEDKIGITFDDYISLHIYNDYILPINTVREIFEIVISLVKDISLFHCNHLIHGDIKPSNFLILYDAKNTIQPNSLSLFDLNSVRNVNRIPIATGSLGFIAPETVEDGKQTNLSDIYSIGATLFYALTNSRYDYYHSEIRKSIDESRLLSLSSELKQSVFLEDLISVLKKCLAEWDQERYSSCDELLEGLTKLYNYIEKIAYEEKISNRVYEKTIQLDNLDFTDPESKQTIINDILRLVEISGKGSSHLYQYILKLSSAKENSNQVIPIIEKAINAIISSNNLCDLNLIIIAKLYFIYAKQFLFENDEKTSYLLIKSLEYFESISKESQFNIIAEEGICIVRVHQLMINFYAGEFERCKILAHGIINKSQSIFLKEEALKAKLLAYSNYILGSVYLKDNALNLSKQHLLSSVSIYQGLEKPDDNILIKISNIFDYLSDIEEKENNDIKSVYWLQQCIKYLRKIKGDEYKGYSEKLITSSEKALEIKKYIIRQKINRQRLRNEIKNISRQINEANWDIDEINNEILKICIYLNNCVNKSFDGLEEKQIFRIIEDWKEIVVSGPDAYSRLTEYKSYNWLVENMGYTYFYYAERLKSNKGTDFHTVISNYQESAKLFLWLGDNASGIFYKPCAIVYAAITDTCKKYGHIKDIGVFEDKTKYCEVEYYKYLGYQYREEIIFGEEYREPLFIRARQLSSSFNETFNNAKKTAQNRDFLNANVFFLKAIEIGKELLEYYKIEMRNEYLPTLDKVAFSYVMCGLNPLLTDKNTKEKYLLIGSGLFEECVSNSKNRRYLRNLERIGYTNLINFYKKYGPIEKAEFYSGKINGLKLFTPLE